MATEAKTQLTGHSLMSPKAELKPEKKPGHGPRSHGDGGAQKEKVIPRIVDFEVIRDALKSPKPLGTYRFGRLSHHSFFSRHHPHPQRVTHIQDLTGKPVCFVKDEFSLAPFSRSALLSRYLMGMPTFPVPVGDPQSNRDPQLSSEAWRKELKELTSRVSCFTKETEQKNEEKQEPPLRDHGAKYSAETGRLIPASTQALQRRSYHQGQRSHLLNNDGLHASVFRDQELLGMASPGTLGPVTIRQEDPGLRVSTGLQSSLPLKEPVTSGPFLYPGASLSDSADRFSKCHSVLAASCSLEGKRRCSGAPTNCSSPTPPTTPKIPSRRKAPKSSPRSSRASKEPAGIIQSFPEEDTIYFQKQKSRN
ncbi:protein TBATA isoform 2-T4 [Thomomys bottae]